MLEMVLTWTGAVLSLLVLLLMILPAVVDGQGEPRAVKVARTERIKATRAVRAVHNTRRPVRHAGPIAA
ncbi:hypothetical protein N8J89_05955 [Crossiella sp. CA-258035]|uniref:hypothetical protein n=1 Tax=Crossiella sp. CA-258035 TaxID=2981138 RepID=UPI0024BCA6E8|nr:hypothetical protein [Crossiella sp. CA-258035]WHT20612.1 hypothetical protein N8J89_05955 [Crossiella sp. CA-258035]